MCAALGAGCAGSISFENATPKAPTGVAITPSTIRPVWGSGLTITGSVSGGMTVELAVPVSAA